MMRVCNLDTCPVGVATQNPELRKRFTGKPEYIVNFMRFIAQELREYMAKLGVKTLDELVGRTDFLEQRDVPESGRSSKVDLSRILNNPFAKDTGKIHYNKKDVYNFQLEKTVDEKILIKKLEKAMDEKQSRSIEVDVSNTDRALGTLLGAEITRRFGESLDEDTYTANDPNKLAESANVYIYANAELLYQMTMNSKSQENGVYKFTSNLTKVESEEEKSNNETSALTTSQTSKNLTESTEIPLM